MHTIYHVLDNYAAANKLSQQQLAGELGMSASAYSHKKADDQRFTADQLFAASKLLGCSMETVYVLERF